MSFIFKWNTKRLHAILRFYCSHRQSHYDTLKLSKNCTDKEIKDAFVKLSKKYHPDKNKDVTAQANFVQIVEAYNVLGKPHSRAQYDHTTAISSNYDTSYVYKTHVPYNLRKNPEYAYYTETKRASDFSKREKTEQHHKWYYGVSGIKKLPNSSIIILCAAFAILGLIIQMFIIRHSFLMHQKQLQEKTRRNAEQLAKVKLTALENGNKMQTQILIDKIVEAANPTMATATLGEALASDKKLMPNSQIP